MCTPRGRADAAFDVGERLHVYVLYMFTAADTLGVSLVLSIIVDLPRTIEPTTNCLPGTRYEVFTNGESLGVL